MPIYSEATRAMWGIGHCFLKCNGSCCFPGIPAALLNRWTKRLLFWAADRCNHTADLQYLTSIAELNPEVNGNGETSQYQRQEFASVIRRGYWVKATMAEANGLKYCMAPSKEDFSPSSLPWSRPGFTEGSSVWKTFPSPLNWPWTQLEVPTTQLRQRERNVAGPGAGAGMFYSSCVSATAGHVPPLQELNHPTHPFLSFTHVTKAQPECTRIYYKSELKRFAESPGFTLASLHLSMSFSIKIHFLLKTMTWSLNFATSKQTYKR